MDEKERKARTMKEWKCYQKEMERKKKVSQSQIKAHEKKRSRACKVR